jgi:hypothetical protein
VAVLELRLAPVAVSYAEEGAEGAITDRCRVCGALHGAGQGAVIDRTGDNAACPGGARYLGLQAQPPERRGDAARFPDPRREAVLVPRGHPPVDGPGQDEAPMGLVPHVLFAPTPAAPSAPYVVVFICNAWQGPRSSPVYLRSQRVSNRASRGCELTASGCGA